MKISINSVNFLEFLRLFYTIQVSFSDLKNPDIFDAKREVLSANTFYLYERLTSQLLL